jgi:hypothetical protein
MPIKISAGVTPRSELPGESRWKQYEGANGPGLYTDVQTHGHTTVPIYMAALTGNSYHWLTTGSNCIYLPTPTGFRVYIRWSSRELDTPNLNAGFADAFDWRINWIAVEPGAGTIP